MYSSVVFVSTYLKCKFIGIVDFLSVCVLTDQHTFGVGHFIHFISNMYLIHFVIFLLKELNSFSKRSARELGELNLV